MLRDSGEHPVKLREAVTSPAGTTINAIRELENHGVRAALPGRDRGRPRPLPRTRPPARVVPERGLRARAGRGGRRAQLGWPGEAAAQRGHRGGRRGGRAADRVHGRRRRRRPGRAAGRSTVTEVVEAPATVQARATSTLSLAGRPGPSRKVYVRDGERVAAGTLLVRISSPETTAQLTRARARWPRSARRAGARRTSPAGPWPRRTSPRSGAFAAARKAADRIPDPRAEGRGAGADRVRGERQYAAGRRPGPRRRRGDQLRHRQPVRGARLADRGAARPGADRGRDRAEQAVEALDVRAPIAGTVQLGGRAAAAGPGRRRHRRLDSVVGQLPAERAGPGVRRARRRATGGSAAMHDGRPGHRRDAGHRRHGAGHGRGHLGAVAGRRGRRDRRVPGQARGARPQVELDAVPGAAVRRHRRRRRPVPDAVAPAAGSATGSRLALGGGTLADGEPAPQPAAGHERGRRPAGAHGEGRDHRAGRRGGPGRRPGRGLGGPDGRARRGLVTVGTQGEDVVAITGGLREGERVVVRGADQVREGQELPVTGTEPSRPRWRRST